MSEKPENIDNENTEETNSSEELGRVVQVKGMYHNWFLDYASYVILERAVPHAFDGLKPVQRRIMHSMKEMDDGRFHKVANIIGNTMKFHPHGDAAIGDAMVQLGQKDLLIDMQGNWGNIYTGDRAAASRYIEARLTKFALEVLFNAKTTVWQASYDGRNKEPVALPAKFPLLLAQGVEGIAVGLACKILPHNFVELLENSIKHLQGKRVKILPDFPTGGMADFEDYNEGLRGGKVKVRARIQQEDKKTLKIVEIPFGTTTSSLIDSILKANDKGKIKVKKVEDNTAEFVEILIHLAPNTSPDKMIDALYAFTDCEVSISPNSCVISDDQPQFISVNEILRANTDQTRELLKMELEIKLGELQEQWHFSSLEKIFIENRIYRDIEEAETWEEILAFIHKGLKPHIKHLLRAVTDEDVTRLTEIKIKRISKFDSFKADDYIAGLEEQIDQVKFHLDNLTDYAIDWFKNLLKKYGTGRERKTEIRSFENIDRTKVAAANVKLMVNFKEGFIGHGLKRTEAESVADVSDIDDIIVIREDGQMVVTRIDEKTFVGRNIIHVAVWKKGDKRTIYNLVYQDGAGGKSMVKRFAVTSITRDKDYPLTGGKPKSKVLHLTVNPNGEAEVVTILHRHNPRIRNLKFDYDFAELAIKGMKAKGNTLTKYPIKRIELKEKGLSTLKPRKLWLDTSVMRLNTEERGQFLGEFRPEDKIITITTAGDYKLSGQELTTKFEESWIIIEKWNREKPISAIYWEGEKELFYVKRFLAEDADGLTNFIGDHPESRLEMVSADWLPRAMVHFDKRSSNKEGEEINFSEFISIKGMRAQGNMLTKEKVKEIKALEPLPCEDENAVDQTASDSDTESTPDHETTDPVVPIEAGDKDAPTPVQVSNPKPKVEAKPTKVEAKRDTVVKEKAPIANTAVPASVQEKEETAPPANEKQQENDRKITTKPEPKASKPEPSPKPTTKPTDDPDDDTFSSGSQITLEL